MAENKTKPTAKSVPEFLEQIENPGKRSDCLYINKLEDIDMEVLEELINVSIKRLKAS